MKRRQGHKRPAPSDRRPEATEQPSITCPVCGRTSYNPTDIAEGYCGNCNDWTTR
jgi:transposase